MKKKNNSLLHSCLQRCHVILIDGGKKRRQFVKLVNLLCRNSPRIYRSIRVRERALSRFSHSRIREKLFAIFLCTPLVKTIYILFCNTRVLRRAASERVGGRGGDERVLSPPSAALSSFPIGIGTLCHGVPTFFIFQLEYFSLI